MENLTHAQKEFLGQASYLVWWLKPKEVLNDVPFLLRQIMTLGDLNETKALEKLFTREDLFKALSVADPGQMTERAWYFWHYRLTNCKLGEVPALPQRFIPK